MKKICGFAMFWMAMGMLLHMLISSEWLSILIICILLVCGYNLFCG